MSKPDELSASLEDFAKNLKDARPTAYWFTLPEEIRDIICASPHATHTIVQWLHSIGYDDATYSKIEHYRKAGRKAAEG